MMQETLQVAPISVTFVELATAFADLHRGSKPMLDRLHDVWKLGAPTPTSIIRDPRGYDERVVQAGNVERRLLLPVPLAQWIQDVSAARGMPLTARQAANMVMGKTDYGELT